MIHPENKLAVHIPYLYVLRHNKKYVVIHGWGYVNNEYYV